MSASGSAYPSQEVESSSSLTATTHCTPAGLLPLEDGEVRLHRASLHWLDQPSRWRVLKSADDLTESESPAVSSREAVADS